jgi:hypothetical protein
MINFHWFGHTIEKISAVGLSILLLIWNLVGYLRLVKDAFLVKDAVPVFKQDDGDNDAEQ